MEKEEKNMYAIAYTFNDMPKYDRVVYAKSDHQIRYYDKTVLVLEEPEGLESPSLRCINLGLVFIRAKDEKEAFNNFLDEFAKHIINAIITKVTPLDSTMRVVK